MIVNTIQSGRWFKFAILLISIGFYAFGRDLLPEWALEFPRAWTPNFQNAVGNAMLWLVDDAAIGPFNFGEFTRSIALFLDIPMGFLERLLSEGFEAGDGAAKRQVFPPLPWIAFLGIFVWLGYRVGGHRLAILHAVCFSYLAI